MDICCECKVSSDIEDHFQHNIVLNGRDLCPRCWEKRKRRFYWLSIGLCVVLSIIGIILLESMSAYLVGIPLLLLGYGALLFIAQSFISLGVHLVVAQILRLPVVWAQVGLGPVFGKWKTPWGMWYLSGRSYHEYRVLVYAEGAHRRLRLAFWYLSVIGRDLVFIAGAIWLWMESKLGDGVNYTAIVAIGIGSVGLLGLLGIFPMQRDLANGNKRRSPGWFLRELISDGVAFAEHVRLEALYTRAQIAFQNGDSSLALELCQEWKNSAASDEDHPIYAASLLLSGRYAEAEERWRSAEPEKDVPCRRKQWECNLALGMILKGNAQDLEQIGELTSSAYRSLPWLWPVCLTRGLYFLKMGCVPEALEAIAHLKPFSQEERATLHAFFALCEATRGNFYLAEVELAKADRRFVAPIYLRIVEEAMKSDDGNDQTGA